MAVDIAEGHISWQQLLLLACVAEAVLVPVNMARMGLALGRIASYEWAFAVVVRGSPVILIFGCFISCCERCSHAAFDLPRHVSSVRNNGSLIVRFPGIRLFAAPHHASWQPDAPHRPAWITGPVPPWQQVAGAHRL